MVKKYYIDISIWIDLYENRKGYNGEPLGDFALKLFSKIKAANAILIITDILLKELTNFYSLAQIKGMGVMYKTEKIISNENQRKEAKKLSWERDVPTGDALHAILARDHKLILISRDNDFKKLKDISAFYKPEDIS